MDVSIIMINYNTYDLTKDAIISILNNTTDIDYELILVDNDSPDKSGEKLFEEFSENIVYIAAGGNLGTSKAFNLGLKKARGKYILWLNTDILIKENFVKTLFNYMEDDPKCGICGGNILDFNGDPTTSFHTMPSIKSDKKNFSVMRLILNKIFRISKKEAVYNYSENPIEVGYICGADMMIRRCLFDELGGFDEDIFMYGEETEFAFRVKQNTDYKIMSVPNAHIFHLEGASFSKDKRKFNKRRYKTFLDGVTVFYTKCYGKKSAIKYLKILRKFYSRLNVINRVLRNKNEADYCKQTAETIVEKIQECKTAA